ncbi:hypothetical protein [Sulfitobacter dubius]|uniref:hypothetical protein n=1 Tax=Sulfitobacter dubius TaxID=218673 RepID=UPI0022AF6606|nr:hypothetical protein [Sulfitobacter dubius]MCZ4366640.1 hypothetical protein [Sulfitobacter dubius]
MGKTITLKQEDLKGIIRMAIKMGSMNLGAKQDRLVMAVFEEAEEKAEDVNIRMPIRFDMSAEGLKLNAPKAGCVVPESKTNIVGGHDPHKLVNVEITADVCESKFDMMKSRTNRFDENDSPRVLGRKPFCDLDEARRRQAVARATMLELELAERQSKLVSVEEADRRVAEAREKAPCLSVDMNEVGTYTIAVFANDGVAFIRTPDTDGAQRLKSLLAKG